MNDISKAWGQVLVEARQGLGWSQTKLADVVGKNRQSVQVSEAGVSAPTLTTVFEYARAVGLAPWSLVRRVEALLGPTPLVWLDDDDMEEK